MRTALSVVVVGLVALSAVAAVPGAVGAASPAGDPTTNRSPTTGAAPGDAAADAASSQSEDACARVSDGDPPDNPESDTLGWENGCWYNESLSLTADDGLNQTELDAVVGRSMARVEQIRDLEFEKTVPVDILSTEAYREEITNFTGNTTVEDRLHQNAKFEALFVLNESEDAISEQQSTLANATLGFYTPEEDRIRIISSNPSSVEIAELTLGHELVHALQDQQFTTSFNRSTTDGNHGSSGIVEGDADFVEARYSDRCDADWDCSTPPEDGGGGGGGSANVGLQVNQLVPYSEGSQLIQTVYEDGGWAAVNDVYANPPANAEQVIHPEKYPDETAETLSIDHSPSDGWRVLELSGGINHATFGEGALYTMMWYASYQKSVEAGTASTVSVPYTHFFNFRPGAEEPPGVFPYNYSHPVTDGWDGDRLVPYVTDESADTGEMGYVWKLNWDTEADATQFHEAYLELLEFHGAEPVEGHENTYRIPEGEGFADAFYVTQDADELVVVNAPTVDELGNVREGAAPETSEPTPTEEPTATPTDEPTPTETDAPEPTTGPTTVPPDDGTPTPTETERDTPDPGTETSSDGGPGFGALTALVAVLVGTLALRRRD